MGCGEWKEAEGGFVDWSDGADWTERTHCGSGSWIAEENSPS